MKRREFVKTSLTAGISAWTAASASRVFGANQVLRVGLIGCGVRGTFDARLMRGTLEDVQAVAPANVHNGSLEPRLAAPRQVEIVALCDANQAKLAAAKLWAPAAKTYNDFRELLAAKDIDAVIIATQDQWHASMLILACQAGKDVYLEKPVMYRIAEAKAMIDAVRHNQRIVQIGTQHRSADHIAQAAAMIRSGQIGEVHFVRVWNYMSRMGPALTPDSPPPPGLNWDAWLGPAPAVPFNRARLTYRSFMDYTNGIISDYGNHRFDSVHQIMGEDTPLKVSSSGMRFDKAHAGDILDLQQATYEYPSFVMSYEACVYNGHGLGGRTAGMRYYGMQGAEDRPHGMAFYGTEAALFVDRIGMELYPEIRGPHDSPSPSTQAAPLQRMHMNEDEPTPLHTKYFVDNVRNRKEPAANIEVGTKATTVACIGNIAYWTGRKLTWNGATSSFPNDEDANRYLFREYRKPWNLVQIT